VKLPPKVWIFPHRPTIINRTTPDLATHLRRRLSERLLPNRFTHVMGVEGFAVHLAKRWGVDAGKVMLAALLHDYCKGESKTELLAGLDRCRDFVPTAEDREHPELWHGIVAAQVAADEFGVTDPDICQAIAHHTTGSPGLGPVGLTLYVADTFEPTRRYAGVEALRRQVDSLDMMAAARLAAETKLNLLKDKQHAVHSNTLRMADWLKASDAHSTTGA
jgi:predicted HD superfamily hydrolase involved in NAD metabolism